MRLLPCPFCGTPRPCVHKHTKVVGFFVYCYLCNTHGPLKGTKKTAREGWNMRPTPQQAKAEDKAFQKALNKAFGKGKDA